MSYNMTFVDNATNLGTVFAGVSQASNNLLGILLLLLVFIVSFVGFARFQVYDDFLISSFITSIIGSLMWLVGIINFDFLLIPIGLLVISILFKVLAKGES